MQYITNFDSAKPVSAMEELARKEPVAFNGPKGTELVVMTLGEYNRLMQSKIGAFKASWRALGEEAQRNGLTQAKLDHILGDAC